MKRIFAIVCLMLVACLLAACAPAQPAPESTTSLLESIEAPAPAPEPEPVVWTLLYQYMGSMAAPAMAETGIYDTRWQQPGEINLLQFWKYNADEPQVLCSLPGCTHEGENCPAVWGDYTRVMYGDGTLLVEQVELEVDKMSRLYLLDADGTNRQLLDIFEPCQQIESLAISGEWLWVGRATHTYNEERNLVSTCEVEHVLYNMLTGEELPMDIPLDAKLLYAWEGGVVVWTYDEGIFNAEPLTGLRQPVDIEGSYRYIKGEGELIYVMESDIENEVDNQQVEDWHYRLVRYNLATGEKVHLLDEAEWLDIQDVREGKLLCSQTVENEGGYISVPVLVDGQTGEIQPWKGYGEDPYSPFRAVGVVNGHYVVRNGVWSYDLMTAEEFWAMPEPEPTEA